MSASPRRRSPLLDASPPFTMAFQPIVDVICGGVFAYEALVRGPNGEGAADIFAQVSEANRYSFDQQCRVRAVELAAQLGLIEQDACLSINVLPNAVGESSSCVQQTLAAAQAVGLPTERIIFEFTEGEPLADHEQLIWVIRNYREMGFRTAIDDFGAGYSGLTLLTRFQPDLIKLDMALIRGVDQDPIKRAVVGGILHMCEDLGIAVVAEGLETVGEFRALRDLGLSLLQGFLFAAPGVEHMPAPMWPGGAAIAA